MLTFPTSIIEPGSWKDKWFKIVNFLEYPHRYWKFKDISKKLYDAEHSGIESFYLKYPFEYPETERIILDYDDMPQPVEEKSDKRMYMLSYFTKNAEKYYIKDNDGKNRAYLVVSDNKVTYMTWHPAKGWFSVDKYEKIKPSNWGRWVKIPVNGIWERFWNKIKAKSFKCILGIFRCVYKFMHIIDSSYLCLRYPYLYPRNRFTGRHYNNYKITHLADSIKKEHSFSADVYISKDEAVMPVYEVGCKSPEVYMKVVEDPENPNNPDIKNTIYYIKPSDGIEYTVLTVGHFKHRIYYPIKVGGEYVVYDLDKETWISLTGQKYQVYSFNNKDEKWECRSYTVIRDQLMITLSDIIMFIHNNIIAMIFFIPTYTELDAMPEGWRRAFGMDMIEELRKQLKSEGQLYKHRITDIKEKFGGLRYYVAAASRAVYDIISKYEDISYTTCICCGKPARYITSGWICPYCEDCIDEKYIDTAKDLTKKDDEDDEHEDFEAVHI